MREEDITELFLGGIVGMVGKMALLKAMKVGKMGMFLFKSHL